MFSKSLTQGWFRRVAATTALIGVPFVSGSAIAQVPQAPAPAQSEVQDKVSNLVEEIYDAEVKLEVTKRRSKIIRTKEQIFRTAIADSSIIEVVAFAAREVEVIGKETGSTTMTLWMGNEEAARVLSILVTVTKDEGVEDKRRLEYGELQDMINEMFPNSKVQLIPIADKLIVRGQARDEVESSQIMALVQARGTRPIQQGFGQSPLVGGTAAAPFPDGSEMSSNTVINMLNIPGEKQVMLKVRIAELKRSAVRRLGANFDFEVGDFTFDSALTAGGNMLLTGTFDNDSFNLLLSALATNGSAKILAEPNLTVLSGKTASFVSGGEFAVPTVVGVGGAQAATTQFKSFGTQLTFTPTVLDKDRIRLQVLPTFSTLNRENQVQGIFGLDSRTVTTTVDLREGQVLAIAGLLQEQQRGESRRIPFIGRIPVLNALTANRTISRDETELIILVTPELVHPLEPEQAPAILPGMEVTEPDDHEFYLYGAIEGCPNQHFRSTVWPLSLGRMKRCRSFQNCQDYYIYGSHGFSQ